jgi:hypothetical protein
MMRAISQIDTSISNYYLFPMAEPIYLLPAC